MNIHWKQKAGDVTLWPERGRVLQARVAGHDAFWVNPQWTGDWNVGGDRLWIAPEADFHWRTREEPDFSQYVVPVAVDSGRWQLERRAPGFCRVRQVSTLRHLHRPRRWRCELLRSLTLMDAPVADGFRRCVAYRTDNELRILAGPAGQPVGLWHLLQVPKGGEMIIGCRTRPAWRTHFGTAPAALRTVGARELRVRLSGNRQFKIGVPNPFVTGRVAYARPVGGDYLVVHREFFPQPWRTYCDHPLGARATPGDAVQVYNDNLAVGGFGEMEYHSPALVAGRGADRLADSSITVVGLVPAAQWRPWQDRWLAGATTVEAS